MHGGTESPGHLGRGAKSAGSYRRVCFPAGTAVLLAYIAALAYYLSIRVSFSLRVEWLWYGWLFLVLEIVGSVSIVGYALILSRRVRASRDEQSDVIREPLCCPRLRAVLQRKPGDCSGHGHGRNRR